MPLDWKTLFASTALSIGTATASYFGSRIYTDQTLLPVRNISIIPLHIGKTDICRFDPALFQSKLQSLGDEVAAFGVSATPGSSTLKNPRYVLFTQLSALYGELAPRAREYQSDGSSSVNARLIVPLDARLLKGDDSAGMAQFLLSNGIAQCPTDSSRANVEVSAVITMKNVETYTLLRTCELQIDQAPEPLKVRLEKVEGDARSDLHDTVEIIKETTKVRLIYDSRFASSTPTDAFDAYVTLIDEAAKGPKATRRDYGLSVHCSAFGRNHDLIDADVPTKCRFRDNDFVDCKGLA